MQDKDLIKYTTALNSLKTLCQDNASIESQGSFMKLYGVSSYFFQALFKLGIIKKTGTPNVYEWLHKKADNETPWFIAMNVQGTTREIQQSYTNKSRLNRGLPPRVVKITKPKDFLSKAVDDFKRAESDRPLQDEREEEYCRTESMEELERAVASRDSLVGIVTVSAEYLGNMTLEAAVSKLRGLALRKAIKGLRISIDYVG